MWSENFSWQNEIVYSGTWRHKYLIDIYLMGGNISCSNYSDQFDQFLFCFLGWCSFTFVFDCLQCNSPAYQGEGGFARLPALRTRETWSERRFSSSVSIRKSAQKVFNFNFLISEPGFFNYFSFFPPSSPLSESQVTFSLKIPVLSKQMLPLCNV